MIGSHFCLPLILTSVQTTGVPRVASYLPGGGGGGGRRGALVEKSQSTSRKDASWVEGGVTHRTNCWKEALPTPGSDLPSGLGGQAYQWGFVCLMETINITGNFRISESGRKFQVFFSCLLAFFPCCLWGSWGQARGFSGPLEHLLAAHGARGARGQGCNCVRLQALGKQGSRGELGRAWAEESDLGCGRLAPDSLVILEDKDLQGGC